MVMVGQDYEDLRNKGMSGAAARTGRGIKKKNKNSGKLESTEECVIQGASILRAFPRM